MVTQDTGVVAAQDRVPEIGRTPKPRIPRQAAAPPAGSAIIFGAPGTGKTHTLRARVAALVEGGADPNSIVVLTKNTVAAEEFALALEDIPETSGRALDIFIGTFHTYARGFARQIGAQFRGINPNYTLWGPDQSLLALEQLTGDHREVTGAHISHRNVRRMWEWHSRNRTRTDLPAIPPVDGVWRELIDEYTTAKRQQRALDDHDLLDVFVRTLRDSPEVCHAWRRHKAQHLVIDDFQDVTPAQYQLVRLLAGSEGSVVVAADRNSAVQSSRGGDRWVIGQFLTHHGNASRQELTIHHRATQSLMDAAKTLQNSPAMPGVQAMEQTSSRKTGDRPGLVVHDGPISELDRRVVNTLKDHRIEDGYDWNDMALLYADADTARGLAGRLGALGISCRDLGEPARPAAPDLLAVQNLLALALNGRDAVAMHNALAAGLSSSQPRNIADAMRTLRKIAPRHGGDLLRAAGRYVQDRSRSTLITGRLEFIMDTVPILWGDMAEDDAHMEGVIRWAYKQFRENALSNPHPQPTADLLRFIDIANRIADTTTSLSAQFLTLFDLLADASDPMQRSSLTLDAEGTRAITLCPIHMAQGFQWRVVFLLDCVDERMPGPAAEGDEDVRHEAQRLFYVAVTRAMDFLHICSPLVDDNCVRQTPSRFLAALEHVLEHVEAL